MTAASTNYLQPVASVLPSYAKQTPASDFPSLTMIDPNLRNGYAQNFFAGVQQSIGDSLTIEVNGTGSLGRRLITTDAVNRLFTVNDGSNGRPNESFPETQWRGSQGKSSYAALGAIVRYRWRTLQVQGAYTWSHAIDQQSDPLVGDFFNLNFTAIGNGSDTGLLSAFARQFDNNRDRGNSDFDQRHNAFLLGTWQSDARRLLTRSWQVSWMAAFRTGFPYTVITPTTSAQLPDNGQGLVLNQRADLLNPAVAVLASPRPATGGVYLLNPDAFGIPLTAGVGTSGRNAFRGPGLYNVDFSLARSFALPRLREGTRLTFRADAFNVLNHANLNNPDNLLGSPTFGLATFGRQGTPSGFPAVSPVNETARQFQILVRVEF